MVGERGRGVTLAISMNTSTSVELGPVRSVLDALSSNAVNGLLEVRRCTQWKVRLWIGKHRALDVVPHSCKVSGRDRNREERKPLDLTDPDIWRDVTAEEQAQSDAKYNRKLKDYEDCKVRLVLHEEVEPDGETVVTKLVRALASNRTVESLYIGTQTCSSRVLLELARSMSTNSTLRSLKLEVCDYVQGWSKVEEEILQQQSL